MENFKTSLGCIFPERPRASSTGFQALSVAVCPTTEAVLNTHKAQRAIAVKPKESVRSEPLTFFIDSSSRHGELQECHGDAIRVAISAQGGCPRKLHFLKVQALLNLELAGFLAGGPPFGLILSHPPQKPRRMGQDYTPRTAQLELCPSESRPGKRSLSPLLSTGPLLANLQSNARWSRRRWRCRASSRCSRSY